MDVCVRNSLNNNLSMRNLGGTGLKGGVSVAVIVCVTAPCTCTCTWKKELSRVLLYCVALPCCLIVYHVHVHVCTHYDDMTACAL